MAKDPAILAHQEWLGYVQPSGLVVSIPALVEARAYVNRNIAPDHQRFLSALPSDRDGDPVPEIANFAEFARLVFGWAPEDLYGAPGAPALPETLEAPLPAYGETLRPTYALHDFQPADPTHEWILLIEIWPTGTDLDSVAVMEARQWQASPQARFERLLRETGVGIGLLVNGRQIRLVYAPRIETSGYITFNLSDMVKVAGRPIFAALHELLYADRMFGDPKERLPAILENSRKYQNVVSTQLAGQVLEALYELLRGFQAADDQLHGELLRDILARDPNLVYAGLLTTLLRLVFLLYAEDRGLLSTDSVYANYYSVTGLYERLRADAGRYPDTMYQRYGAWAQLLALFRLVYEGGSHGGMRIPPREGYLFDSDRYLFLEGQRQRTEEPSIPRVSDGVLYHVLSKLMVLDGERLSYRTLAVEQIGSVYETIMGFDLHVAAGRSIAIKPAKKHGAPATVNLEGLLAVAPDKRQKWMAENTDQKLTGAVADALKAAETIDDLLAALDRRIARAVTPNVVPKGAMIFQPSDERRRSGSHYTPSALTRPIVEAALKPVLRQLGDKPTPGQILSMKVCDPAMGSGAFLVETCRQLGDALAQAWHDHDDVPVLPPDEDEVLHAQRQVAQRCLYGVDKNPLAADLAKLSLWLATLAKNHPFTFLDHSLRAGDSLAGLTRRQIAAFHWLPAEQQTFLEQEIRRRVDRVSDARRRILAAADDTPYATLQQKLDVAEQELYWLRLAGDAVLAAFFSADKPAPRDEARKELRQQMEAALKNLGKFELAEPIENAVALLRSGPKGVTPFHWEMEFPEVFTMDARGNVTGGFDSVVGNPPFMGGSKLSTAAGSRYTSWLSALHSESQGRADLVSHFFRRAFTFLPAGGTFGLIATNTIRQGDTRETGLYWIRRNGGTIYRAETRKAWPGAAAVVVSAVHVIKSQVTQEQAVLNGELVDGITAYLFHMGPDGSPSTLRSNRPLVHSGTNINGKGFVLTREVRDRFISECPSCSDHIRAYLGAEEMNETPDAAATRFVINMEGLDEDGVKRYPVLYRHLHETVRVQRQGSSEPRLRDRWWLYSRPANELYSACTGMQRILASGRHAGIQLCFAFQPTSTIFSDALTCFIYERHYGFAVLQSRVHEVWAHFFGSSLKDDLRYIPEDCFETFPLPPAYELSSGLESTGKAYYEHRAALMLENAEGLTKTYNRFHDPEESDAGIIRLRELHDSMDRAVLDAYGWTNFPTHCEFIPEFDAEDDEDEGGRPRRKKYRYQWPDEVRDDILLRLLLLNRQRVLEEGQLQTEALAFAGATDPEPRTKGSRKKAGKRASEDFNLSLLPQEKEEA